MTAKRGTILGAIIVMLALATVILYLFAKANYYTASDVFWYGAIAGFLGCLIIVLLVLIGILAYKLKTKRTAATI